MIPPSGWSLPNDHVDDIDLLPFEEADDDFAAFLELLGPDLPCLSPCHTDNVHAQTDLLQAATVPQTTTPKADQSEADPDAVRLERIRAKNRRGQAKYREKLKVHHNFQRKVDSWTLVTRGLIITQTA